MDIMKMLAELRSERAAVEEAIIVLERIARSQGKHRGRPPAWMTGAAPPREKTYTFSAEARAGIAAAARRRWAEKKKANG